MNQVALCQKIREHFQEYIKNLFSFSAFKISWKKYYSFFYIQVRHFWVPKFFSKFMGLKLVFLHFCYPKVSDQILVFLIWSSMCHPKPKPDMQFFFRWNVLTRYSNIISKGIPNARLSNTYAQIAVQKLAGNRRLSSWNQRKWRPNLELWSNKNLESNKNQLRTMRKWWTRILLPSRTRLLLSNHHDQPTAL